MGKKPVKTPAVKKPAEKPRAPAILAGASLAVAGDIADEVESAGWLVTVQACKDGSALVANDR